MTDYVTYSALSFPYCAFVASISAVVVPNSVAEALDSSEWRAVMQEEIDALTKNHTWDMVPLPPSRRAVGCKWVYTVKHHPDGSVARYKARLVAKGYAQTQGVDYQETFAPVAKMNTIRVILSLAALRDWLLFQLDVKNVFLHGTLNEEVYMVPPPGFHSSADQRLVCRLRRSLYGLKQSPRAWADRFTKSMLRFGFQQSHADHTLFLRHRVGKMVALIVYVDDIVLTGDDVDGISEVKSFLNDQFEVTDLGHLRYFLGIEVARSSRCIYISQRKYILDLLQQTGLANSRPVDTPVEVSHRLADTEGELLSSTDASQYQRLVGKLIYLTMTRPDIAYVVGVLSQFMYSPRKPHWDAAIRVLHYLKGCPDKGILYSKTGHLRVESWTDADYAGSVSDRRSTSSYCMFLEGNLVTWRSKKQSVVSRSSAEAEYRAMALGICELLWPRILLTDLKIPIENPMILYCDNKSAISIAADPVQHDRTKHIEIDRHFIREKLISGVICTPFVPTSQQTADVLTKLSVDLCLKKLYPSWA
ncbi:hypothetical protein KSP39_PZI006799 [Platanthera zijinensis]|uniref:Reverse transcriptase Ty1/copia-type domain-containing protein n=1 Tax=Platanthera zijinensis TaxID=2320716 RepID=A0AAP0G9Q4_9ASPA